MSSLSDDSDCQGVSILTQLKDGFIWKYCYRIQAHLTHATSQHTCHKIHINFYSHILFFNKIVHNIFMSISCYTSHNCLGHVQSKVNVGETSSAAFLTMIMTNFKPVVPTNVWDVDEGMVFICDLHYYTTPKRACSCFSPNLAKVTR